MRVAAEFDGSFERNEKLVKIKQVKIESTLRTLNTHARQHSNGLWGIQIVSRFKEQKTRKDLEKLKKR